MPAFDPVRDAVLNSPIDPPRSPSFGRRATDLSVLLNDDDVGHHRFPIHRPTSNIHSILADDALGTAEPFRRASTSTMSTPEQRPRSSTSMTQVVPTLPYNPKRRTAPGEVLVPLSLDEIQMYRNYRGQGGKRLTAKRKRAPSDEPETADTRTAKRHTGDVGVVVEHCKSHRPFFSFARSFRLSSP